MNSSWNHLMWGCCCCCCCKNYGLVSIVLCACVYTVQALIVVVLNCIPAQVRKLHIHCNSLKLVKNLFWHTALFGGGGGERSRRWGKFKHRELRIERSGLLAYKFNTQRSIKIVMHVFEITESLDWKLTSSGLKFSWIFRFACLHFRFNYRCL